MNFKQLFRNEDAVSPVIGVILMVAITVILAAVIGTFVLGLGQNVQDTTPQVSVEFEAAGSSGSTDVIYHADATLNNGGTISTGDLTALGDGSTTDVSWSTSPPSDWETGTVQTINFDDNTFSSGDEVDISIRHDPSDSIIAEGTVALTS